MNFKIVSALSNIKCIFAPLSNKTDSLYVIIIDIYYVLAPPGDICLGVLAISRRKNPNCFPTENHSVNVLVFFKNKRVGTANAFVNSSFRGEVSCRNRGMLLGWNVGWIHSTFQ